VRAAKTSKEYEETGRAQDELSHLERDMRRLDITLEDVGAKVVNSILKIFNTGGYRLEGKRADQGTDVLLQLLASMVAMRKEEKLQAWNTGNDSKFDIVTTLRPMFTDVQAGDITGLAQAAQKNQAAGGKRLQITTQTFEIKIPRDPAIEGFQGV